MTNKEQIINNFAKDINVPGKEKINKCECTCDDCGAECEPFFGKNKEQIIIDGVDVSRCVFYQIEANKLHPKAQYCGSKRNIFCEDEPNCYFKQLARKTQECEELKEEYEALKLENKELYRILADLKEVRKLKDRYRKALDEIEEYQKRNCEVCYRANTEKCNESCQVFVIFDIINKAKGHHK